MPISFSPNPVSTVGSGLQRAKGHAHMAIARFFYDVGLPLDAVNSVYFQPMVSAIFAEGAALVGPSYHDLRGWILKNVFEEVKNETNKYMGVWGRTGCSILVDELKTEKGLTILNILVYCPEGTMFLRSIDASHMLHSTTALYELLKDVVEEVGIENVLQVITNCEEHYRLAGRRLTNTFPTVYWTPCATQSLNLMFEDFSKVDWINAVLEQAKCITRFVYSHSFVLNMMRRFTFGNDLVVPESTSYATNFMTLKRMVDLKHNLQGMVTSEEWMNCPYSKRPEGLAMLDYVSNQSFWSSCILITRLTEPLLRVLRMVRSERRPAMGYVYAGIYRAKEAIKKEQAKRKDYLTYWNIIDRRWGELQSFPLHAAGFYLNPKFFYSIEGDIHNNVVSGLFDCIERLVPDTKIQDKIMKEISSYKNSTGDFGRKMAIRARDTLLPEQEPLDPISLDNVNVIDDWVTVKELCLEEYGSADWMMVDPPLANTRLLGSSNDEIEGLGTGFDDLQIFDGRKDDGEENDENHITGLLDSCYVDVDFVQPWGAPRYLIPCPLLGDKGESETKPASLSSPSPTEVKTTSSNKAPNAKTSEHVVGLPAYRPKF
ncbi:protein of unknown function DUF659 [Dillenia turbinata]|uniref:DUF659 domain-containing protein n=1 Tax=Dillenia turbinata TaxID=194707 RepID=A0AAN8VGJ2_9MAGN